MSILSVAHLQGALADVAAALRAVTVAVQRDDARGAPGAARARATAQGSGILWSADGTIVTNAHVVPGRHAAGVTVTLADGRRLPARVVVLDGRRDLAVLQVGREALAGSGDAALPVATLGEPSRLRPGEMVLALGHPFGVPHALAVGVVHAAGDSERSPYVLADLRLAPGNSGGPLADAAGRIVGVNSMIVNGLGVAISVDAVRRLLADTMAARRAA